jgi:hypothetical protein
MIDFLWKRRFNVVDLLFVVGASEVLQHILLRII